MAKFKAGDKVVVRDDLIVGKKYGSDTFTEPMKKFKGREVTIQFTGYSGYTIEEDFEKWTFTDEMLVGKPVKAKKEPEVKVVQEVAKMEILVERVIFNDPATIMFYRLPNYNYITGQFESWRDVKKVVAKCNVAEGDTFNRQRGVDVCLLKAFRKEADKVLAKM